MNDQWGNEDRRYKRSCVVAPGVLSKISLFVLLTRQCGVRQYVDIARPFLRLCCYEKNRLSRSSMRNCKNTKFSCPRHKRISNTYPCCMNYVRIPTVFSELSGTLFYPPLVDWFVERHGMCRKNSYPARKKISAPKIKNRVVLLKSLSLMTEEHVENEHDNINNTHKDEISTGAFLVLFHFWQQINMLMRF